MPTTKPIIKAVVSGHTQGLGAAIAENLLGRGIAVLGLARGENGALARRFPALLEQVGIDLADSALLANWLAGDALRDFLAGCQSALLINNAGMLQPVGPLQTQDAGTISRAVALNVAAPLMLAGAMVSASADAAERRIVHISSGAARNAYAGWSVYCATKSALDHHARAVALDMSPGLRICSIAPGIIDTAMQAQIRAATLDAFPQRERFDALERDGELARPEACARRLVDHILSDAFGAEAVADLRDIA